MFPLKWKKRSIGKYSEHKMLPFKWKKSLWLRYVFWTFESWIAWIAFQNKEEAFAGKAVIKYSEEKQDILTAMLALYVITLFLLLWEVKMRWESIPKRSGRYWLQPNSGDGIGIGKTISSNWYLLVFIDSYWPAGKTISSNWYLLGKIFYVSLRTILRKMSD